MRFAGQGYVAQSNSGGGPVHGDMRGRDWGGNPVSELLVHGWPDRGHGPNPYYRGRDYPGLETMEIKPGWMPPSPETMEIKPGWRPLSPQTMEIRY